MTAHLTEEEQLDALKRWWKENGKSTVIGAALAVAGYLGWGAWQDQQQLQAEAASATYQALVQAVGVEQGQALSDDTQATIKHLAGELKADHSGNLYAAQAALYLAKLAVEDNDLDAAAAELQWVLDQKGDTSLELLARSRLARVQLAQSKYDEALALIPETMSDSFKSNFAETRGDILLAKGDTEGARGAYQLAIDSLIPELETRRPLLQMKVSDLQAVAVSPVATPSDSDESEQALPAEDETAGDNS